MSGTPIRIRGREYKVERVLDSKPELQNETVYYRLTGVRGAQYFTMRNVHTPNLMFLMPNHGFSPVMERVWLSDESGELVVVSE